MQMSYFKIPLGKALSISNCRIGHTWLEQQ